MHKNVNLIKKISLGTAQFGMDYGVTNKKGQCTYDEVLKILAQASALGISNLDTAPIYGNSEKIIGNALNELKISFKITSKIPKGVTACCLRKRVEKSLICLQQSYVDCLLFHSTDDLLHVNGVATFNELSKLKNEGIVKKIGASIYNTDEMYRLFDLIDIDTLQVPVNIFDQRFTESSHLHEINKKGISIQGRSVFLQGILLQTIEKLPEYFKKYCRHFNLRDTLVKKNNCSLLDVSLLPISVFNNFDRFIIAFTTKEELLECVNSLNKGLMIPLQELKKISSREKYLIDPRFWR